MLCAIRHPETFKLQSLLVDTDRMCGSLRLRLRRVARGRLSRKSWTDDERNTQNGPGFEADEQVSPGASFAGQELAQGLCAQNLSPDCLQLAGEVQTPVLPAAQRWPAPTSSQTAYSAAVSRRPASTAGVDLTKFARDDHGHIRHLTNEERVYVK